MNGRTVLHLAVENQLYFPIIEKLVGSDINLSDRYGFTALDYAAILDDQDKSITYVKLLLIFGALPKLNDRIKVSDSVRKIITDVATDVAKTDFVNETQGIFVEKQLQKILFDLYNFKIQNPNINKQVSMTVARKLFGDFDPIGLKEDLENLKFMDCLNFFELQYAKPTKIINVSKKDYKNYCKKISLINSQYNWYTNGKDNLRLKNNKKPPKGYKKGRTL
jgi:hypothetical protein